MAYGPEGGIVASMSEEDEREHVAMLLERLSHENPEKRRTAAEAVAAYIGDKRYLPDVIETHPAAVLADVVLRRPKPSKTDCISAAQALALMGSSAAPHAGGALAALLSHSDHELKLEVARTLRQLQPGCATDSPGVAAALARSVATEDSAVLRYEAARALCSMGASAAEEASWALAEATEDEDTDVQIAAVQALSAMGSAVAGSPALSALVRTTTNGSFELQRLAVAALASMGSSARDAAAALGPLLRPLPGSDPKLRREAAEALGAMGSDAVREQQFWLARAMADPDEQVRQAAEGALILGGCRRALRGSMVLGDPDTDDEDCTVHPSARQALKQSGMRETRR